MNAVFQLIQTDFRKSGKPIALRGRQIEVMLQFSKATCEKFLQYSYKYDSKKAAPSSYTE